MESLLTIVGLLGGFVLSFVLWWILARAVVPRIAFSADISKVPDSFDGCVRYRIKIVNVGRRDIIDLSIRVRIYLPASRRPNTNIVEIPISAEHLFILRPRDDRIFSLELGRVESRYLNSDEIALLKGGHDGSLERLLDDHRGSFPLVQLLAYDGWSGARRYYRSDRYRSVNIKEGRFRGLIVGSPSKPLPIGEDSEGEQVVEREW